MTTLIPKFDLKDGGSTPTGAINRPINKKLAEIVSVKDFGATGDGTTDDTTAIQAAITATLTATGGELYFPNGTYLISSALNIPSAAQWRIHGQSRGSVIIKQNTNNTPIFYFAQDGTWGWSIENLTGTWNTAQASTNTAAIMFSFYSTAGQSYNWYNFYISNITCTNGFRGLSHAPSAYGPIWGFIFEKYIHGSTMSGSAVYCVPASAIGQPNIKIDQVYVRADNMVSTESAVAISAGDSICIDNFEVNNAALGSGLLNLSAGTSGYIGTIKTEAATYTTSNAYICTFTDSNISINNLNLTSLTINTAGQIYGLLNSGGSGSVKINNLRLTFTSLTGIFYCVAGSSSYPLFSTVIDNIGGLIGVSNVWLTNAGSSSTASSTSVTKWANQNVQINGDSDVSLNIGTNTPIQLFTTNLTTGRTVTLADQALGSDSNLYVGFTWTIVNAQPTYANAITINQANTATVASLASNGYVKLTWYRFGWAVTGYGTWSGTTP